MRHLAEYYEMEGRYQESHDIYQDMLERVTEHTEEDEEGKKDLKISEIHTSLGMLAQKYGKYEKALEHLEMSHLIFKKLSKLNITDKSFYQKNDLMIANCMCKTAQVKISLGKLKEAETDIIESCYIYDKWSELLNDENESELSTSWIFTSSFDNVCNNLNSGIIEGKKK